MHRLFLLAFGPLLASTFSVGQTTPTDSQTLQALLGEVRQLRKDLQTTAVASQRVQILLYRSSSNRRLPVRNVDWMTLTAS